MHGAPLSLASVTMNTFSSSGQKHELPSPWGCVEHLHGFIRSNLLPSSPLQPPLKPLKPSRRMMRTEKVNWCSFSHLFYCITGCPARLLDSLCSLHSSNWTPVELSVFEWMALYFVVERIFQENKPNCAKRDKLIMNLCVLIKKKYLTSCCIWRVGSLSDIMFL